MWKALAELMKRFLFSLKHSSYNPKEFWEDRRKFALDIDEPFKKEEDIKTIIDLNYENVLEIGCGRQNFSILPNYLGLDFSKRALKGQRNMMCTDVCHLPFRNESFDIVVSRTVLMHIPNIIEAIEEIKRVCKKAVLLIEFHSDSPVKLAKHCFNHDYEQLFCDWNIDSKPPFEVYMKP